MCDYRLHCVASRPAKIGEKMVTSRFPGTITRGFAAVGEPNVAVCLLPGTEVVFDRQLEYEHVLSRLLPWLRLGKLGQSVARFRQGDTEQTHAHADAQELPSGRTILLTRLRPGQHATVIQLPASGRAEKTAEQPAAERAPHADPA